MRSALGQTLIYAVRTAALYVAAGWLALRVLVGRIDLSSLDQLMLLVGQLDVYRALFHGLLPAAALLVLLPARRQSARRPWLLFIGALAATVVLGWLPLRNVDAARPGIVSGRVLRELLVYLDMNLFVLIYFHWGGRLDERLGRRVIWSLGLADLALPMLVWAAYRQRAGRALAPLRLLPALLLCAAPFLALVNQPQGFARTGLDQRLSVLREEPCFSAEVIQPQGDLIVCGDYDPPLRLEGDGRVHARLEAQGAPELRRIPQLAQDARSGELLYLEPVAGLLIGLEPATLEPVRTIRLSRGLELDWPEIPPWRTLVSEDGRRVAAFSQAGLAVLDPQSQRIAAWRKGALTWVAYDQSRNLFHVGLINEHRLEAWDADTLRSVRGIELGGPPDRIVLDDRGRLFVALPAQARVLVLDAADYRVLDSVPAFPGVRAIGLDEAGQRLVLAGVPPLLELRSLDDFRLLERMQGPAWVRWIAVDQQRGRVYLCSYTHGLCALDLDKAGPSAPGSLARRLDPFYPLLNLAGAAARRVLGL